MIKRSMTLPTDSAERKQYPLLSGCLKYFPAALAGVAHTSKLGNDKHNPGEALHHARGKSMDHGDCILRHLMDAEDLLAQKSRDTEAILLEVNQMVWRALAYSQQLHELYGAPLAPAARLEEETKATPPKIFISLDSANRIKELRKEISGCPTLEGCRDCEQMEKEIQAIISLGEILK